MFDLGPVGCAPGEGVKPAIGLCGNRRQGLCKAGIHDRIPILVSGWDEMSRTLGQQAPHRLVGLLARDGTRALTSGWSGSRARMGAV